ncbi:hypothetical protein KC19_1G066100 [Ceratodon purpureus]|uniref:Uncharacterized protein n=1 Tax=Ceratodon purpureus TaxID=3225 RepID=A0A8T0J399_CERPU|nr:hypothetical protein KC19_1G066100 [Ceratodon purpureus]
MLLASGWESCSLCTIADNSSWSSSSVATINGISRPYCTLTNIRTSQAVHAKEPIGLVTPSIVMYVTNSLAEYAVQVKDSWGCVNTQEICQRFHYTK